MKYFVVILLSLTFTLPVNNFINRRRHGQYVPGCAKDGGVLVVYADSTLRQYDLLQVEIDCRDSFYVKRIDARGNIFIGRLIIYPDTIVDYDTLYDINHLIRTALCQSGITE